MPRLYLMRHADAGPPPAGGGDRERRLSAEGRLAAARMGGWLASRLAVEGRTLGHVCLSGVARTDETLSEMVPALGALPQPVRDGRIYDATAAGLLGILQGVPEAAATALLVGHNPALEGVLAGLTDTPLRPYPTGGIAELELATGWAGLGPATARLLAFAGPHDLD